MTVDDRIGPRAVTAPPSASGTTVPAGTSGRWLGCRTRRPDAALRLYCFPHSGGSIGEYLRWDEYLPEIEVCGIQLPGRGARLGEPPITDLPTLVDAVLDAILPAISPVISPAIPPAAAPRPPFALFGHSLGAVVAYEVAAALRDRGRPQPVALVLSGSAPPHRRVVESPIHQLPDRDLIGEIQRRYGGMAPELAEHPELIELMLPACRSDFTISETYRHTPRPPLDVPITVLGGDADTVPPADLADWCRCTTAGCRLEMLPGGHFYFRDQLPRVAALIRAALLPTR